MPTVFVPSESAFQALDSSTIDFLSSEEGRDTLVSILRYHIATSVIPSMTIDGDAQVNTTLGVPISVSLVNQTVFVNEASVIAADKLANNGIVHVIDRVLQIPQPPVEQPSQGPSMIEISNVPSRAPSDVPTLPPSRIESNVPSMATASNETSSNFPTNIILESSDTPSSAPVVVGSTSVVPSQFTSMSPSGTQTSSVSPSQFTSMSPSGTQTSSSAPSYMPSSPPTMDIAASSEPTNQLTLSPTSPPVAVTPNNDTNIPTNAPSILTSATPTVTGAPTASSQSPTMLNFTTTPTSDPTTPFSTTPSSSPTLPSGLSTGNETLYDRLVANGLILASLVDAAGLQDSLSAVTANLTVLAPINESFEALPPRTVEYLGDNPELLIFILLGHVLSDAVPAAELFDLDGTQVTLLNGLNATVNVTSDALFIGGARVLSRDILASNGILHTIDRILGLPSFLELITQGDEFVAARALFEAAGIRLDTIDDMTVFLPTTQGILSLGVSFPQLTTVITADPDWQLHAETLLLSHVTRGIVFAEDVKELGSITTLTENVFEVSAIGENITLQPSSGPDGTATITAGNVITTRAVVHVIDSVLIPSFLTRRIVDIIRQETSTLASAIVAAELDETFEDIFGVTGMCSVNVAQILRMEISPGLLSCSFCSVECRL